MGRMRERERERKRDKTERQNSFKTNEYRIDKIQKIQRNTELIMMIQTLIYDWS